MFHLDALLDYALLFLRIMVGLVFAAWFETRSATRGAQ